MDTPIIPWQSAKEWGEKFGQDIVIILSFDSSTATTHVVTWGQEMHQSEYAADKGNQLNELIGWAPENCKAVSAKVQALIDINTKTTEAIENLIYHNNTKVVSIRQINGLLNELLFIAKGNEPTVQNN